MKRLRVYVIGDGKAGLFEEDVPTDEPVTTPQFSFPVVPNVFDAPETEEEKPQ